MLRLRSQRAFTLIEILVAATLASVGIAATIGMFGASRNASRESQRREVAVQQAQATIDRMQVKTYEGLALTSQPTYSAQAGSPLNRVSGNNLQVKSGLSEALVVDAAAGQIDPGPEPFVTGSGDSQISGKIYRFVTWRDENCATGVCDGTQNTKRVTVAIQIDNSASKPIWVSSVGTDPTAAPPGNDLPPTANPGSGTSLAQTFYLYDTRCSQSARTTISASHATHDTSSRGTGSNSLDYSTCETIDLSKRPDLMGVAAPSGGAGTTLYKYSNDLNGDYPGGLAMKAFGSSCPTSYLASQVVTPGVANQWNVHSWAANTFTSPFNLSGRVVLQLYTQSVGGVSGRGMICATLLARSRNAQGIPVDTVLGSSTYDNNTWPTTPTGLTFTWDLPGAVTVPANSRLVLALSVRGESANDLVFLYDHPSYLSFLQVATTTPLQ